MFQSEFKICLLSFAHLDFLSLNASWIVCNSFMHCSVLYDRLTLVWSMVEYNDKFLYWIRFLFRTNPFSMVLTLWYTPGQSIPFFSTLSTCHWWSTTTITNKKTNLTLTIVLHQLCQKFNAILCNLWASPKW